MFYNIKRLSYLENKNQLRNCSHAKKKTIVLQSQAFTYNKKRTMEREYMKLRNARIQILHD